jgi:tRNA nucleotidyltransferase (CCA-adding enzyme)
MDFFAKPRRFNAKIVNQIKSNLLIVEFKIQKRSPDILWGQLKRKLTSISKQLSNSRFEIIKKSCFTDEEERAVFIFMIEFTNLPKISVNRGPQIYLRTETDSFINKRGKKSIIVWIDGDRIVSIEGTKNMSIKEHASRIIQNDIDSGNHDGITSDLKRRYSIYLGNERKLSNFVSTAISHMVHDGEFIRQ